MTNSTFQSFSKYPVGSLAYINEYNGYQALAVAYTFIALETIFLILRFVSRSIGKVRLGPDDYLIIPAWFFCISMCLFAILGPEFAAMGRHLPAVMEFDPEKLVVWSKYLIPGQVVNLTAICLAKLSIIFFFLRICTVEVLRIISYVTIGIVIASCFACIVTTFLACRPLAAFWDPNIPHAACIDTNAFWRYNAIEHIFTDVVIFGLPMPIVWRLRISMNQKLGLMAIFMIGSIGLISSVITFTIFLDTNAFIDETWTSTRICIWAVVEPGVYFLAACLTTFRPLILWIGNSVALTVKTRIGSQPGQHSGIRVTSDTKVAALENAKSRDTVSSYRLKSLGRANEVHSSSTEKIVQSKSPNEL